MATADLEDDFLALDDSFVPMQDHEHKHDHGDLLEPYASSSKPDLDDSDLGGVLTSPALDQESEPEKQHDPVLDLDINLNHEDSHDTDEMLLMETDGDVPPLLEKASDTPADDLDKSKPDLPSKMANEPFARVDNATDPPHLEDKPASDNN